MIEQTAIAMPPDDPATATQHTGILPFQTIRELVRDGEITAITGVGDDQIQPASLDLRLGVFAWRVRASFLPGGGADVRDKIGDLCMHEIDISGGAVLEKGCVYIVPLQESLALGPRIAGLTNPKSSTGRLDVFTRMITDRATEFETVRAGYSGPLYAEISPRAFSVVVRENSRLNQLRLWRGSRAAGEQELRRLHSETPLVDRVLDGQDLKKGVPVTVDLTGSGGGGLIGYKAKKHTGLVDIDQINQYEIADYWEPIRADGSRAITLNPDDFYILASKEIVTVPPTYAAEMVPYDTLTGEFRVHYAGFFDPGFGHAESGGAGARAVLEVRSHDVPFLIEDGQIVGRLVYERMCDVPDLLYGAGLSSSYQGQGLSLGKQFKRPTA